MRLFLILTCVLISYLGIGQSFGEMGSKWTYSLLSRYQTTPNVVSTEKDTVVQGKNCHILNLEVKGCEYWGFDTTKNKNGRRRGLMVYEEDSVVYFWEWNYKRFEILYDFGAQPDSFWITHYFDVIDIGRLDWVIYNQVDSIDSIMINGSNYKILYVTSYIDSISPKSASYQGKIIDRIGGTNFLTLNMRFNRGMCDFDATKDLRCFESPSVGQYSTGIVPSCDYTNVGIEEETERVKVTIYPNPVSDILHLKIEDFNQARTFRLYDLSGQLALEQNIAESATSLDLSTLPKGMYFYGLADKGNRISQGKIVKQ
ncbi:MAG: T9SS type A sorting domain-containing protein [Flavobacteriales bacterium]|nr:T9SS type A sorting domain-containing protein [Flavobacteriales bacterium]